MSIGGDTHGARTGRAPDSADDAGDGVPPDIARDDTGLAARQAALVRALVANGPAPAGFPPDVLAVTAEALLRKRAGLVARHHPQLALACGPDFPARFAAWASGRPGGSVAADAAGFAAAQGLPFGKPPWWRRLRR